MLSYPGILLVSQVKKSRRYPNTFDRFHDVQLANHSVRALVSVAGLFLMAAPYKFNDGEWSTDKFALESDHTYTLLRGKVVGLSGYAQLTTFSANSQPLR